MKVECFNQPLMLEIGGALSYINVTVTTGRDPEGTLLCLHDIVGKGADFQPLADVLAAKGWKVIAPDFPGRGRSTRVPSHYYTLGLGVDVAAAVLRAHPAQRTFILGCGWGATLALAVENTWRPAPLRIVLCDLPMVWTYGDDPRAQLWSQLANVQTATDTEFMETAQKLAASFSVPMTDILDLVKSRLNGPDGARSLGVDPGVFEILHQTARQPFAAGYMLRVSSAEMFLLYSRAGQGSKQKLYLDRFMPNRKPLFAEVSSASFGDWDDAGTLLPILGAILC